MTERKGINHRLINTLRHAHKPVSEEVLVGLYHEPTELYDDVAALRRYNMVQVTPAGVAWAGS